MKIARSLLLIWVGYKMCENKNVIEEVANRLVNHVDKKNAIAKTLGMEVPEPKKEEKQPIGFKVS